MYAPLPTSVLPPRVIFFSRNEPSVRSDAKTLRGLGIKDILHIADSSEAFAFFDKQRGSSAGQEATSVDVMPEDGRGAPGGKELDLIICDEQLADMPASVFLYALSQHTSLRALPVLVLTGSEDTAMALRAAGLYVLERPYTQDQLQIMVQKAMSPLRRILLPEAFTVAAKKKNLLLQKAAPKPRPQKASDPMTTSDWYAKAMEHLNNQELELAGLAMSQVLERQEDHVDAWLVLAKIERLRKNSGKVRRALIRAAAASLRQKDKMRAVSIAGLLPDGMLHSIFTHEALCLMEENKFRQAALSFLDAELQAAGTPLHRIISRACLLTPKPETSMTRLCDAFGGLGYKDIAVALRKRLLEYAPFVPVEESSWLDRFPLLKEAVCVASFTAWAWRQQA